MGPLPTLGAGPSAVAADPNNPGKTNLISWWSMDETSGTRTDSHGSNDLTDNNTVGYTTGKQSNAGDFVAGNQEYLSISDNASLSTGDIDFTICGWVRSSTLTNLHSIFCKESTASTTTEWILRFDSTPAIRFYIGGSSYKSVVSSVTLSVDTWYFFVAWHDSAADTINIQVNNGTVDSAATTGVAPSDTSTEIRVGATGTSGGRHLTGNIDELSFWKRVLSSDERTWTYNSGSGRAYSELS